MKKNYLKCVALLLGLTLSVNALAENAGLKTKAVYSYGAMLDGGFSVLPTAVVRSFYDVNNRLVRMVEADIMLADSEGTPEVEVPGQEIPKLYSAYEYDEKGVLQKVRTRKYGLYSAFERAWTDFVDAETYEYDTNGKLVKKNDATYITTYKWEGENMVEETAHYTKDGAWSSTIKYTAFAEGVDNMPVSALFSDKWKNNRIYEYAYDGAGNKIRFAEYKVLNAELSDKVLVAGEKGDLYAETTWTYVEGVLTEEVKGYWNSGKQVVDPSTKIAYEVKGDTTTISTYQYFNGAWGQFGGPKKSVIGVVDNVTSATGLTVTEVEGEINTVLVKATAPVGASTEGWNIFRNGMCLGSASLVDGVLTYQDKEVPNGRWDYFFQQADGNTSEVMEITLDSELPAVENVVFLKNSLNATGDYEIIFTWDAPNTTLPILGYNVYADILSYETNPAPENGMVMIPTELALDTLTWMAAETNLYHEIYVETVYSIGKSRSKAIPVELLKADKMLKVVMTMGDAMGSANDNEPSKAETYYYDADNKLVRKMIYGKLLGDDEDDPDQIYKAGDWVPMTYTAYDYNENGQLIHTRERQYGMYSGYNKVWNEFEETGSFSYDEEGRLKEDTTTNRVYHYEYDANNNVVKETYANSRNVIIYHKYCSDFVEGLVNCPQYAFANSPYGLTVNDRIYEYTYDNRGNMLTCRAYKYDNSTMVKDDEGNVIGADKGTLDYEEIWTYEKGLLVQYEKNIWKTNKDAFEPKTRIEYTQTEMGTKAVTWNYSIGIWAKGSTSQVTWEVPFEGKAASDLNVEMVKDKVNTLSLKAMKPSGITTTWNVFRNGVKIGQAVPEGRYLVYEDANVPNGHWDYFIQAEDTHGSSGVNVSNVVELDVYTELPAVTDIKVVSNHYNDVQDYEVVLDWEAPVTDLPIKGYNMFVDVKDITKNPSPVNGLKTFEETTYTYTAANDVNINKTFMVETVYNIGKVKSEAIAVVLQKEDPQGLSDITVANMLILSGRTLWVNGEYRSLNLYATDGAMVGNYGQLTKIDLSNLASGVYVVHVGAADGNLIGKIVLK